MTLNPTTAAQTAYDMLDGSLSAFYQDVDEAIVASEVVKGQYRLTVNPAYNSPNPVAINNFTTVGLSQSGPMVVNLENSFITTTAHMKINLKAIDQISSGEKHYAAFFIGWKSSIEAINRYDVLVNSTPIYNQSFCGEESFLQYQVLNENVKHTSPYVYTSYQEAKNMSPNVCGTYVFVDVKTKDITATDDITVDIPIKIPITNFMILRNLKYLLSWMGKWELRLYFNYDNMIVLPIDKDVVNNSFSGSGGDKIEANAKLTAKGEQFHQISQPFRFLVGSTVANTQQITVKSMVFENVEMVSAQFQIRMDVCEGLKQKYLTNNPLIFPVSTFQIAKFTQPAGQGQAIASGHTAQLDCVLCQAINNCDTLFIIPAMTGSEHTVCSNPNIENFQLHAGEYGTYPTQPFDTYEVEKASTRLIRYVNLIGDCFNVNNSALTSFNSDTWGSHRYQLPVSGVSRLKGDNGYIGPNGDSYDKTNYCIGIPFSTDDDFQGGLSSPSSNINFKITGQLRNRTGAPYTYTTPWTACFLIDGTIMVRPDPGSDAAKVIWSDRTVV